MKILVLSDMNTSHTQKWVTGLREKNVDVFVFSLLPVNDASKAIYEGVPFETLNYKRTRHKLFKVFYLKALPTVRRLIRELKPDIVHAHYASSYGLIGALTGFKNLAVSVWGTDVYVFPKQSRLFEKILKFVLSKARRVFSTSNDMASETVSYYSGKPTVIPFGSDCELFRPGKQGKGQSPLKFATAKSLKPIYNIPLAIRAFQKMANAFPDVDMELHIAGDGPEKSKCLAASEGKNSDKIFFHDNVSHADMPGFFSDKHVLINIPDSESFGVSVIEASASGLAVIVTNAGGLPEVVVHGETGYAIPSATLDHVCEAMRLLIEDRDKISEMGKKGRAFVLENYSAEISVSKQITAYREMISQNSQ